MAAPPAALNDTAVNFGVSSSQPCPLPTPNPPPSHWLETSTSPGQEEGVHDGSSHSVHNEEVDLLIIGSGITGVSAAYHAAHKWPIARGDAPLKVKVLEARDFCSGATGRNGGHLTPLSPLLYADISRDTHYLTRFLSGGATSPREEVFGRDVGVRTDDVVRRILALDTRTYAELIMLVRVAARNTAPQDDPGLVNAQNWVLCLEEREAQQMESSLELARTAGFTDLTRCVRKVGKEELDQALQGAHGVLSAYEIAGATVHPRRLVSLLWRSARARAVKRGVDLTLLTNTPVQSVRALSTSSDAFPARAQVTTPNGTYRARYVLHATNGYVSHLCPQLAGPSGVVPTRAQVISAKPRPEAPPPTWEMGLSANGSYEYLSRRPDGEHGSKGSIFIFGGGRQGAKPGHEWDVSDDASLNPDVTKILRNYLPHHLPSTFSSPVECTNEWTGIMGFTRTWHPLVGPLLEGRSSDDAAEAGVESRGIVRGQYVSAGYSGHGMTRAFSCAEVCVDMMVAEEQGAIWNAPTWFPMCYLTGLPRRSTP